VRSLLFVLLVAMLAVGVVRAADVATDYPQARTFFPDADRFGVLEGTPRAAPVHRGERLLGYVFLTGDVVRIPAYSGKPINTLVGFDLAGRITGLTIVQHEEPILAAGITEARLHAFTDQYRGKSVFDRVTIGAAREGHVAVDAISGATITVMVQNATVMQAARRVAESRGLTPAIAAARAAELPALAATRPATAPSASALRRAAQTATEPPLWVEIWRGRTVEIGLLVIGLAVLAAILVFQDWLAQHPTLLWYVRRGFLLYTLFFIGWYALAQLSIVHVFTFVQAVMREFHWETFLIDPMLFILWGFVALTLLLWGRGVYCGWLCPFGALQELANQAARRFSVRQLEFSDVVHERLSAVKYLVLILLFGVSLQSTLEMVRYAEVEPFKTAVTLRFQREWPLVLYAAGLIGVPLQPQVLLQVSLPAGRGAHHPRAVPGIRLVAAPAPRMRPALPDLRDGVRGARDPADGRDQRQRVPLLPRLPGDLLQRGEVHAAGRAAHAAPARHPCAGGRAGDGASHGRRGRTAVRPAPPRLIKVKAGAGPAT
jgi:hypothetical protein